LEAAGARILDIQAHNGNRLSLSSVLQTLRLNEVKSLMVEGGAQVIESFLAEPIFVDKIVITIAPVLMGANGVGYHSGTGRDNFEDVHTELFGKDTVVALTA
jgi:2,5-diamino-6-(ribosylamino)-4(3H)-pyrimidinone 5'-phosphate reductase